MNRALAVDCSTGILHVAVQNGDASANASWNFGFQHAQTLLPFVRRFLADCGLEAADLDLIVASRGPGSFTGLRIGMSTCKGLALAGGKPLVAVGALDAWGAAFGFHRGLVLPVIDARRKRFYTAPFRGGRRVGEDRDAELGYFRALLETESSVLVVGPDARLLEAHLAGSESGAKDIAIADPASFSPAALMIELGLERLREHGPDKDNEGPVYLRPSDAEEKRKEVPG